jgi:hypothetical protein
MRAQILATAAALMLAVGATTGAIASSHKASHARHHHAVRSAESWRQGDTGYRGGFIDLGPLGFTAACGSYAYKGRRCGQGYSVSAWTY